MTVRDDNRLADQPLRPVTCSECGAVVSVRKSSWEQTSVQWTSEAMRACSQRREAGTRLGSQSPVFLVCPQLRASIEDAARSGQLPMVDESSIA